MASWGPTELYCLKCFHIKNTPDSRAEYAQSSISTTLYVPPEHSFNPYHPRPWACTWTENPKPKKVSSPEKQQLRREQNRTQLTWQVRRWRQSLLSGDLSRAQLPGVLGGAKVGGHLQSARSTFGIRINQNRKICNKSGRFHLVSPQAHSTSPQICARK